MGFIIDQRISKTEGFSFGEEILIHFDGLTDTGRDIYLIFSKALWSKNMVGEFPLDIYIFGVARGKMAERNIKFLLSNLFVGFDTEVLNQCRLC